MMRQLLVQRCVHTACLRALHRSCLSQAPSSGKHVPSKDDSEEAVKFTTSKGSNWDIYESFETPKRDRPKYQPVVIGLSLTVFLVYFGILREENDVDQALNLSLFESVPGLEEQQIRISIKNNLENGLDTKDLERRLDEILKEKNTESVKS